MKDPRQLAKKDGRYAPDAFDFLFQGLDRAVKLAGHEEARAGGKHVSGLELLEGIKQQAFDLFGPLTPYVWRSWGVRTTLDWGNIVFLLVEAGLLNRQEEDSLEEFAKGFDFEEVFVTNYRPSLPRELGVQPASDEA